jgi:transcriptional regulator with XRE-family HTH domain
MSTQEPKGNQSLLGQVLKEYRKQHNLTQEQLAYDLHVEPRTLRAWENERPTNNMKELYRIADLLGIEPEQLGLSGVVLVPRTPEQIEEVLKHVWFLVDESRLREARTIIEQLAKNLRAQITTEDPALLRGLAQVYHSAGYIVSEATQAEESCGAMTYYQEMEGIARLLKDPTMLNIALTYHGDMYRRLGKLNEAATYLEAARDETPGADKASLGNGIQLLARVYLRKGESGKFEQAMRESEEISYTFDPATSSTRGHYSPGTVYEEYGRSYADMGMLQKAIDYLEKAEQYLPRTKFWSLLLKMSRAVAFIRGYEIESGIQLAIEATEEIKALGVLRYLDRIHLLNRYLGEMEQRIGKARKPLQEALYGGIVLDY